MVSGQFRHRQFLVTQSISPMSEEKKDEQPEMEVVLNQDQALHPDMAYLTKEFHEMQNGSTFMVQGSNTVYLKTSHHTLKSEMSFNSVDCSNGDLKLMPESLDVVVIFDTSSYGDIPLGIMSSTPDMIKLSAGEELPPDFWEGAQTGDEAES